ncbi:MAG: formyl transferase [Bacteroidia bacterium]|jgi:methionyl-tRNA formyltransferase|nr:formyl transferase [Bacteroidia bacterium]
MTIKKIVLLAGSNSHSTTLLFNAIDPEFEIHAVIIEQAQPRLRVLKNRAKKLGWIIVAQQVLFQLCVLPLLKVTSQKRLRTIIHTAKLHDTPIPTDKVLQVVSANNMQCIDLLNKLQPDIVLVNGTRILSKKLLESVPAIFINMHAGITPMYRGVHGGYWALTQNDSANCGVTIHQVDAGVDTGATLFQSSIQITPQDNFYTYPYLQFVAGLPFLKKALTDWPNYKFKATHQNNRSRQWYHPTLLQYLYFRIIKGVK